MFCQEITNNNFALKMSMHWVRDVQYPTSKGVLHLHLLIQHRCQRDQKIRNKSLYFPYNFQSNLCVCSNTEIMSQCLHPLTYLGHYLILMWEVFSFAVAMWSSNCRKKFLMHAIKKSCPANCWINDTCYHSASISWLAIFSSAYHWRGTSTEIMSDMMMPWKL